MTTSVVYSVTVVSFTALLLVSNGQFLQPIPVSVNTTALISSNRIVSLCPTGWTRASAPKPGYDLTRAQLCVRVNLPGKRWVDATGQCRQNRGFMAKLDAVLTLEDVSLFDHLRQRGIHTIWSGMHHKYGSLLWDDLRPRMVKGYIGPNEPYGWKRRGYTFDQSSYKLGNKTCGYLTLAASDVRSRRTRREVQVSSKTVKSKSPTKALETIPSLLDLLRADQNVRETNSTTSSNIVTATAAPSGVRTTPSTTTTTTTTDQSDLEDNENHHPIPTTPPAIYLREIPSRVSTISPANSTVQSAKGTSLPASTSSASTTPQPNAIVDEFLNRPLDAGLESHGAELITHDDLLPRPGESSIAFNTQDRTAVQAKSSVVSSESIDSNEAAKAILMRQMVDTRQQINTSANVVLKNVNASNPASTTVATVSRTTLVTTNGEQPPTTQQSLPTSTSDILKTTPPSSNTTTTSAETTTLSTSLTPEADHVSTRSSLNLETTGSQVVEDSREKLMNGTAGDTDNKTASTSELENSKENSDGSSSSESSSTVVQSTTEVPSVTDTTAGFMFSGSHAGNLTTASNYDTNETTTTDDDEPSLTPFSVLATPTQDNRVLLDNTTAVGVSTSSVGVTTSSVGVTTSSVGVATSSVGVTTSSVGVTTSSVGVATSAVGVSTSSVGVTTSSIGVATSAVGVSTSSVGVATSAVGVSTSAVGVTTSAVSPLTTDPVSFTMTPPDIQVKDTDSKEIGSSSESMDMSMEDMVSSEQLDFSPMSKFSSTTLSSDVVTNSVTFDPSTSTRKTTGATPQRQDTTEIPQGQSKGVTVEKDAQIIPMPMTESRDSALDSSEEQTFPNTKIKAQVAPSDIMALGDCEEERSSVCVTEAIESLSLVSHCDRNWFGHRLLDKCYNPVEFTLTEIEARQHCLRYSATLASADTDFYGNITALLLADFVQTRSFEKRVWLDTSLNLNMKVADGLCSALENQRILRVSCTSRLPFICQKDAQFARTLEDYRDNMDTVTYIQNMTSFHPQTLPCPLGLTAFDDVIVWFKDGRPILDPTDDDRNSFGLKNGQLPNSLVIDLSILEKVGELDPGFFKPAMLQGEYWCEIWRKEPFHRVTSHRIFLKFTDVITLRGVIITEPASYEDAAMFNRMGMRVGLPAAMELRLTSMNKNITHFLRGVYPIVRDVITFLKNTNPSSGRSEFVTYICTATGDLTPSTRGNLADLYLSTFYEALVQNEDYIRSEWRLTLPLTKAISVSMTDLCPSTTLLDKVTGHSATFLSTVANNQVMSVDFCNGRFSGTAYCKGNLMTGAYWDAWRVSQSCQPTNPTPPTIVQPSLGDVLSPSSPSDQHVTILPTVTVPESAMFDPTEPPAVAGNVEHIRISLTHILAQSENMTHSDIETVAQLANSAAGVHKPPREIGQMLMETVNKVLDSPPEELMRAETESNAPSRLLADMERFGSHVDMGVDPHFRYVTPNIAMDMWDLNMDNDVVIGLGATEASSWSIPLTEPRILTIKNRTWSELNLPGFDVAIELPESLVRNTIKYSEKTLRLTMFLYRKTAIFQPTNEAGQFPDGIVNSAIISASLGDHKIRGLEDKVRLVFKPFKEAKDREKDTKCVFWDTSSKDAPKWSTEGCTYNGTLNGRDVCLCDHLTNFAILLDFYGDAKPISPENETSLNVLSLIGISLSIFGLAMTIITFLAFKKLRQGRAQQTLFNMAIALLCFQTTFLVGVKQTTVKPICLTVSALLHYFILVSFAWMLIEAVLQYLTFVKVLGTYISRYTLKTVLPAWGFPLVPVIAVLATDYNLYHGRANYCWMDLHAFYYSLALPVGIIIVFNIVMFFVIIASLVTRPKGLRSNQTGKKTKETNLKAAVTIFILLGLTWMFGYLAIEDARVPFQYAFTILSSLQGFLIFILMVVRRKQVRDQWSAACCAKGKGHQHHQRQLSPTSSNSTTSNNSRTLPSFINHTYTGDSLILKTGLRRENSVSI